ncbi:MAG: DNA polymerase III subunit alpha, partial [Armatimonadota bacterium]
MSSLSAFPHLHVHSAFSFGDGASSVSALVLRAAEAGVPALALTDTMSLSGIPSLVRRCTQASIKPVGGCDILLEGGHRLPLLADGPAGFASLCRILSLAGMRDIHRAGSRARWEDLEANAAGIVCLTGSPEHSAIPRLLRRGRYTDAEEYTRRLCDIFGAGCVFVEVTRSLAEGEHALSNRLFELADHLHLPAVATNAAHYATKPEMAGHEALRRVSLGLTIEQEHGDLPLNAERYLKPPDDIALLFPDRPDALRNAVTLAERLASPLDPDIRHLPTFPKLPRGETAFSYLSALVWAGAEKRWRHFGIEEQTRLIHELETIKDLGYSDYFLVCWDVCGEARRRGIGHGLRGSAVGSAVAFCLQMSPHDPITRRVSFERFLSKARKKPPDIDIDFRHDLRDEMMDYTRKTYGEDRVANVANYVTYRGRSLLRDLGKVLGHDTSEIDRLRELLHFGSRGDDIAADIAAKTELRALGIDPSHYTDLFALCGHLAGLPRHLGTHSSGIVVSDVPLCGVVPLQWAGKGVPIACFDKDDVESPGIGLLKMDQLSLRALTAVDIATNKLAVQDPAFDYPNRNREDGDTLALIRAAQTVGVFQLESPAQMALQWRLQADKFDDLVASVALIRPGPLLGGSVTRFIKRRKGWEKVTYPHPDLEPVLAETYGRILFQDQVLDVVRVVGGFEHAEADAWLKTMTHARDRDEMLRLGLELGERAVARGMAKKGFSRLWKQIEGFSRYGFCHGHALAFADHAQGTAWLLARYPAQFYAAILSVEPCGFWPVSTVVGEAKRRGIASLAPCLNRSHASEWLVEKEGDLEFLRCSLNFVDGVSLALADAITRERLENGPFTDLADACARLWFC